MMTIVHSGHAQWTTLPDMTIPPFDGGYSFVIEDKIYVGSGKEFRRYDPTDGTWEQLADFPGLGSDRKWANAFVVNNKAYVGMGYGNSVFHTDLWQYDPSTDVWSGETPFPAAARGGSGTFTLGNKGYICGGTSTGPTFSEVYSYEPTSNVWTMETTLPTGTRGFPTAWSIGNYGYVYGGYVGTGNETAELHRYDPATNSWDARAEYPGGGRQSAVVLRLGGLAAVGMGHAGFTTGFDDFYVYWAGPDVWAPQADLSSWTAGTRISPVVAAVGTTAYMGAGSGLSTFLPNNDWWSNSIAVGIDEPGATSNSMSIFPTPSENVVTLSWGSIASGTITLFDISGATVLSVTRTGSRAQVDLTGLAPGTYTAWFTATDGSLRIGRIMKR